MRRLNKYVLGKPGIIVLDLQDVVALLSHQRKEAFEGERAVRLFQFRTWIVFPAFSDSTETNYPRWAELITAAKFLDRVEEHHFADREDARQRELDELTVMVNLNDKPPQTLDRIETLRKDNKAYRDIYDRLIGRRGGLLALLSTPAPADFDRAINDRIDHMHIISDLIDYRLRYIQHCSDNPKLSADQNGANHNHALFFCWWPTHEVKGKRGKTSPNKSVSTKTMRTWWNKLEGSALFIYLIQNHGFRQFPMDTDDDFFVDNLLRDSKDETEILRFLGAYAYLTETFKKAHGDLVYVPIPESIPRVPISTSPFSEAELETISQYDEHYTSMTE